MPAVLANCLTMSQPWKDLILCYRHVVIDQWVTVECALMNLEVPVCGLVLVILDPVIDQCYLVVR